MNKEPYIIELNKIGDSNIGFITVAEEFKNIPFEVKRVYWTYFTPNDVMRGGHAHKKLNQIIFAVAGVIEFNTEDNNGKKEKFILEQPNKGLYIPNLIWREIKFSHNAVLLCLTSEYFDEADYIRDYNLFKSFTNEI
ncbi:MAG: FdtA/QdtA family cupin domain-containing protein [Lutibacter sp.]|nr:FdtA/QdtA family cupin domain-containing protein [Lutibacter sp.]